VLQCARVSRDSKSSDAIEKGSNRREEAFLFAERLERSGLEIKALMVPWQEAPEHRIAEVADDLFRAGADLEEMAASYRQVIRGADSDEYSAVFKSRKEDLVGRWFSATTLVGHRDSTKWLVLTVEEKRAIVRLIENELFASEMTEFDETPNDLKGSYITEPDLWCVIAFRTLYKRQTRLESSR